jgi:fructose-1,6-bisphosphatase/inositol monophosphatase family enzyme
VCSTSIEYFADAGATPVYARLAGAVGAIRGWSDCYGALLTATGRVDAWVEPVLNLWDAAAVFPVIREAGGLYTDWAGVETPDSPNGLASNGIIHEALRTRLVV